MVYLYVDTHLFILYIFTGTSWCKWVKHGTYQWTLKTQLDKVDIQPMRCPYGWCRGPNGLKVEATRYFSSAT